jgi:nucleoid-associated protein YgaU/DNA-binding SARP family transcriptional activator
MSMAPVDDRRVSAGRGSAAILLVWLAVFGSAVYVLAGWPPAVPLVASGLPSSQVFEIWLRSPSLALDALLPSVRLLAWVVWAWTCAYVVIRVVLRVLEWLTRGAAWVHSLRSASNWLMIPAVRRVVDASLAGLIVIRVAMPMTATAEGARSLTVAVSQFSPFDENARGVVANSEAPMAADTAIHKVRDGDTWTAIAKAYYGDAGRAEGLLEANVGREQPNGRVISRHGLIYPGWTVVVPAAEYGLVEERDGRSWYTVRPGDSLASICAERFGDESRATELFEVNRGARLDDRHVLSRPDLIWPGLRLELPRDGDESRDDHEADAARWYVVQRGDTLRSIAARQLGDEDRYDELFDLNAGKARLGSQGPVLEDPDLIWPNLRIRIPGAEGSVDAHPHADLARPEDPELTRPADVSVRPVVGPDIRPLGSPTATVIALPETTVAKPESTAEEPDAVLPRVAPLVQPEPALPLVIAAGLVGGSAALTGWAAWRVHRRRRPHAVSRAEPEITLDDGFAQEDSGVADSDPATAISARLSRAYAGVLAEQLPPERLAETRDVSVISVRHGHTSTMLALRAPLVARAHLLQNLQAVTARAFGDRVDVEGMVSHEGDVLVRVFDAPVDLHDGQVSDTGDDRPELWPSPCLVTLGLLHDGQPLAANWDVLSHILVASPTGSGAETVLTSILASLVGRRTPGQLGLVTLAEPRALPEEIDALPHQLLPVVSPQDAEQTADALAQVRSELTRRRAAGLTTEPDLVVVIAELGAIGQEQQGLLSSLLADGARYRVRVLAASARPGSFLVDRCPFLGEFGTRLVLRTSDEEESLALLGADGADELGPGGHLLFRLEGRTPVAAHGFRVAPDRLARMVAQMQQEPVSVPPMPEPDQDIKAEVDEETVPLELPAELIRDVLPTLNGVPNAVVPTSDEHEPAAPVSVQCDASPLASAEPATASTEGIWPGPKRLQQIRSAPIQIRCFGGREVWYGDEVIWPNPAAGRETGWELLLILAVHPVGGVQTETLSDILWPDRPPKQPAAALRKRRYHLRQEIQHLIPDFEAEVLPTDRDGLVYSLDPAVAGSDVHLYLELLDCAKALAPLDAIAAYEEALALYRGDLLDGMDVPSYWWLYQGPALATTLRSDYLRLHREARMRLADLYVNGPDGGLPRAEELYVGLTAEDPTDEQLWAALFRVHARRSDSLGLDASVRRLRLALVELGEADSLEKVELPSRLSELLREIRDGMTNRAASYSGAAAD